MIFTVAEWRADQESPTTIAQEARKRPGRHHQARPFAIADLERKLPGRCGVEIAVELGIQYRQLHRLRRSGLTVEEADRFAVGVGMHPSSVWSSWWTAG